MSNCGEGRDGPADGATGSVGRSTASGQANRLPASARGPPGARRERHQPDVLRVPACCCHETHNDPGECESHTNRRRDSQGTYPASASSDHQHSASVNASPQPIEATGEKVFGHERIPFNGHCTWRAPELG